MKSMLGRKVSDECTVSFIATVAEEAWWQKLGLDPSNGTGRITDNERLGKTSRAAGSGVLLLQHQRHRFKNTAGIGIDAHTRAGPVP